MKTGNRIEIDDTDKEGTKTYVLREIPKNGMSSSVERKPSCVFKNIWVLQKVCGK